MFKVGRILSLELRLVVGPVLQSLLLVVVITRLDLPGDVHVPDATRRGVLDGLVRSEDLFALKINKS